MFLQYVSRSLAVLLTRLVILLVGRWVPSDLTLGLACWAHWFAFLIVLGRHRLLCWLMCVILVSISTFYTISVSFVVILSSYFPWVTWGAFVHVAIASPCPGFNRGKNAPGGGRGSRSPPLLCDLLRLKRHTR